MFVVSQRKKVSFVVTLLLIVLILLTLGVSINQKAYASSADIFISDTVVSSEDATFTVSRKFTGIEATIKYRTVSGTAIAGTHFIYKEGSLTFGESEMTKDIIVIITNANAQYDTYETTQYTNIDRTFYLEIYDIPSEYVYISRAPAVLAKNTSYEVDTSYFSQQSFYNNVIGETVYGGMPFTTLISGLTDDYYNLVADKYAVKIATIINNPDGYQTIGINASNVGINFELVYEGDLLQTIGNFQYAIQIMDYVGEAQNLPYASDGILQKGVSVNGNTYIHNQQSSTVLSVDNELLIDSGDFYLYAESKGAVSPFDMTNIDVLVKVVEKQAPVYLGSSTFNSIYENNGLLSISLVFDKIIDDTKSDLIGSYLTTSSGEFTYVEGVGSNVLVFEGYLSETITDEITISAFSGSIKDFTGNETTELNVLPLSIEKKKMSDVYLDMNSLIDGDGTESEPFNNWASVKTSIMDFGNIYVMGTISIEEDTNWNLSDINATVKRIMPQTIFEISNNATLTLTDFSFLDEEELVNLFVVESNASLGLIRANISTVKGLTAITAKASSTVEIDGESIINGEIGVYANETDNTKIVLNGAVATGNSYNIRLYSEFWDEGDELAIGTTNIDIRDFESSFIIESDRSIYTILADAEENALLVAFVRYKVTFVNGNGEDEIESDPILAGMAIGTMPVPLKFGYELKGWNTQSDGLGDAIVATDAFETDITVYARWSDWKNITLKNGPTEGKLIVNDNEYETTIYNILELSQMSEIFFDDFIVYAQIAININSMKFTGIIISEIDKEVFLIIEDNSSIMFDLRIESENGWFILPKGNAQNKVLIYEEGVLKYIFEQSESSDISYYTDSVKASLPDDQSNIIAWNCDGTVGRNMSEVFVEYLLGLGEDTYSPIVRPILTIIDTTASKIYNTQKQNASYITDKDTPEEVLVCEIAYFSNEEDMLSKINELSEAPQNAGTYYYIISRAEEMFLWTEGVYCDAEINGCMVIAQANVTVTANADKSITKVFDGKDGFDGTLVLNDDYVVLGIIDDATVNIESIVFYSSNVTVTEAMVYVSISDANNYNIAPSFDIAATITPLSVNVVWESESDYVYNGLNRNATVLASYIDINENKIPLDVAFSGNATEFMNAGQYTGTASNDDANYNLLEDTREIVISKAEVTVLAKDIVITKTFDNTKVCDVALEKDIHYTVQGIVNDAFVSITSFEYNSSDVIGASHINVDITISDSQNYIVAESFDVNANITPYENAVVWVYNEDYIFIDQNQESTVSASYKDINNEEITASISYSGQGTEFENSGNYVATASTLDTNYVLTNIEKQLVINKAQSRIIANNTQTFIYNGEIKNVFATLNHSETDLVYDEEQGYANANEDGYTILIIAAETENYFADSLEITLVIHKATIDMSSISFGDKIVTYDGTYHSIYVNENMPNEVSSIYYYSNSIKDVGEVVVTAEFIYDKRNYNEIPEMSATITVTSRTVFITIDDQETVYGQPLANLTYSITNLVGYDDVSPILTKQGDLNVGMYDIVGEIHNPNYVAEFTNGSYTISKFVFDMSGISFKNVTNDYNAKQQEVVITGILPEGVQVVYTNNKGTNAGTYHARTTFVYDEFNYEPIENMNALLIIKARKLTVAFNDATKLYADGTIKTISAQLNNIPKEETAVITPIITYNKEVKAADYYTATVDINNDNYVLSGEITKAFIVYQNKIKYMPDADVEVQASSEVGFLPDTTIGVINVSQRTEIGSGVFIGKESKQTFDIIISNQLGANERMSMMLLIDNKYRYLENLTVAKLDSDGSMTEIGSKREGDYLIFDVYDNEGTYIIIGEGKGAENWILPTIALGVFVIAFGIVGVSLNKRRKRKLMQQIIGR